MENHPHNRPVIITEVDRNRDTPTEKGVKAFLLTAAAYIAGWLAIDTVWVKVAHHTSPASTRGPAPSMMKVWSSSSGKASLAVGAFLSGAFALWEGFKAYGKERDARSNDAARMLQTKLAIERDVYRAQLTQAGVKPNDVHRIHDTTTGTILLGDKADKHTDPTPMTDPSATDKALASAEAAPTTASHAALSEKPPASHAAKIEAAEAAAATQTTPTLH